VAADELENSGLSGKLIWTRALGFTRIIWSKKVYIVSSAMSTYGSN
jgi:hypothetical protein